MKNKILLKLIFSLSLLSINFVLGVGSGGGGYIPRNEIKTELQQKPIPSATSQTPQQLQTSKPVQTQTQSPTSTKAKVVCSNLKTLSERVKCRLSKSEEELSKEPFLPEECRGLTGSKKKQCLNLYKAFNQCFEQESNLDSCALKVVGLKGNNPSEWVKECQGKKGTQMAQCKQNLRNKFLNYVKSYLYNLSYRLEEVKDKNNLDKIAEFITLVEKSKQELNKANDKTIDVILDKIDKKWNEVVNSVSLPENFDENNYIKQLKEVHGKVIVKDIQKK